MKANEVTEGRQSTDGEEDWAASDDYVRRPRLTLRHLNKLRKIRELRRLEKAQREKEVHDIYGKNRDSSDDSKPTMIPRKTH